MLHVPIRLVLQLHCKINDAHALLHVRRSDVSDPAWNCRGKQQDLQVSSTLSSALGEDLSTKSIEELVSKFSKIRVASKIWVQKFTYLVDLFFEALLEHLVGLIQDHSLQR